MLTKTFLVMMISFIFSLVIGGVLIPILSTNASQRLSIYLSVRHSSKKNTPTMGGLIFVLSTILTMILLLLFNDIKIILPDF